MNNQIQNPMGEYGQTDGPCNGAGGPPAERHSIYSTPARLDQTLPQSASHCSHGALPPCPDRRKTKMPSTRLHGFRRGRQSEAATKNCLRRYVPDSIRSVIGCSAVIFAAEKMAARTPKALIRSLQLSHPRPSGCAIYVARIPAALFASRWPPHNSWKTRYPCLFRGVDMRTTLFYATSLALANPRGACSRRV
jgi:hypothetical protein